MILKIFLLISFSILINAQEGKSRLRKPKIFYVSTHETSTTISTHTVCYKTSTAHTQCARRKRRSLEMVQKLKDAEVEIRASSVDIPEEDSLDEKVEDLLEKSPEIEGSNDSGRDPRFQIYWLTTTKYVHTLHLTRDKYGGSWEKNLFKNNFMP